VKKIDTTKVKPLEINSALRYLWARHRISILSDYNRLNPQDERIKEVTNLGLTYNLLTAYTSFVAIDTQIRLRDGHAITVKQPLPLPQGVSDYAVGKRSLVGKGIRLATPSSNTMPLKTRVREESLEYKKEDRLASEPAIDKAEHDGNHIQLKNIAVTEGLPKDSIQRLIEKNIPSINLCYAQALGKQNKLSGELVFTSDIDSEGKVIKVNAKKGIKGIKEIEQCIIQKLKKLHFPAPERGKNAVVTITFLLR
jgi:Ca-activated chloride channel family protein